MKYKPAPASKANENAVKIPLINEHNAMGVKFRDGDITAQEWKTFKKDWGSRFKTSMHNIVKDRIYVEDNDDQ